jgi:ribonuclease P protein component
MTVFYLPRTGASLSGPRVGVTVSRVMGGAVTRNRIKRRMREAIRLHLATLTADVDVVFNPKKLVLDAEFTQVEQEVKRAFDVVQKNAQKNAVQKNASAKSKERSTAK